MHHPTPEKQPATSIPLFHRAARRPLVRRPIHWLAGCWLVLALGGLLVTSATAQERPRPLDPISKQLKPDRLVTYKSVGERKLQLHLFEPTGHRADDRRSVFLIIHGGGWTGGYPWRCYPFADYLRDRGMLAITIDYRLLNKSAGTTVFDCVRDGRSAVRYVRQHAAQLGADPDRIVLSGCSAGGHVAAGTALFDGVDDAADPPGVSCVPNAMVLYYPVIDTSPEGYGQRKIGDTWKQLSPLHQVRANLPPTMIFHGTGDTVTPYRGAAEFQARMRAAKNICELVSHPEGIHGYLIFEKPLFDDAMARTVRFLESQVQLRNHSRQR
ncbi:MAG: alpha/beta hydrolase [Planctomycetales bacterium]|nr:alpha/beta hydrolase [Planctomycetales bacterium]